jgi:uncharacterized protein YlxW (UPF0749 family)
MTKIRDKKFYQKSIPVLVGVGLGILVVAQANVLPTRVVNPIAPYVSLKETRESLYADQNSLKNEISSLQNKISQIQKDNKNLNISKSDFDALEAQKTKAGMTMVYGPGVILSINDSSGLATDDSIVHAADVRDILNLLWGSGAEAITVNDERVVASTAVDCIVNTILINNTRISTPIVIRAVGNKEEMATRLNDKSILTDIHRRVAETGLRFDIQRNDRLDLPPYRGTLTSEIGSRSN